jgi:hypothetical protein
MKSPIALVQLVAVFVLAACTTANNPDSGTPVAEGPAADTTAPVPEKDTTAALRTDAPPTSEETREDAPDGPESTPMTDEEQAQAFLEELPGTYESREQWTVQYAGGEMPQGPAVVLDVSRKEGTTIIAQKLQLDMDYGGGGGASEAEAAVLGIRKVGDAEFELKMEQSTCKATMRDPMEGDKEFSDATKIPFTIRVDAGSGSRMRFKASKVNSACPNVWTLDRYKFKRKR